MGNIDYDNGFSRKYAKRLCKGKTIKNMTSDDTYAYIHFTNGEYLTVLLWKGLRYIDLITAQVCAEIIVVGYDKKGNVLPAIDED